MVRLNDYFKKKFGEQQDGWETWNRDDELAGRGIDSYPLANICPARKFTGNFNKRGIAGQIVANVDYNVQDGEFIGTDTHGRKHIVQEDCDGTIVGAEPLELIEILFHEDVGPKTNLLMRAITDVDYYIGEVIFKTGATINQAVGATVHVLDGADVFSYARASWTNPSTVGTNPIQQENMASKPRVSAGMALYYSADPPAGGVEGVWIHIYGKRKTGPVILTRIA